MNAETTLARLRRFLLALAGLMFAGTVVELAFREHTEEPVQFIPFFLCGLGIAAAAAALLRPERWTLLALRASAILVGLGSLVGMYYHIAGNIAFQLETRPGTAGFELAQAALGGAAPLLAPGILALAGVLAFTATYAHPALQGAARPEMEPLTPRPRSHGAWGRVNTDKR